MIVIIAEKPDMMKKISNSLSSGSPRKEKGYHSDGNFVFTNAIGHLVENKKPNEIDDKLSKWDLKVLPFYFDEIPLKVSDKTKTQYALLKKLTTHEKVTEIVNACDSDREGELIFRNILKTFPKTKLKGKKFSRMWLTATTPQAIKKAFEERRDLRDYNNLSDAARARSVADYLVGMNGTMAMTSAFAGYKNVLSIGRVQTPTLKIIVDLEEKIKNFKKENFWTLLGIIENEDNSFEASYFNKNLDKNRFFKKEEAEKIKEKIGLGDIEVVKVSDEDKNVNPKKLFNLSDLQIEAGRKHGFGAQSVLSIAQALYEKHSLISYPRTDENNISKEFEKDTHDIVKTLGLFEDAVKEILDKNYKVKSSFVVNKEKIGSHEAITPVLNQNAKKVLNDLTDQEKKVYQIIVQRFLESFYPPAVKRVQKAALRRNGEIFQAQVENIKELGYMKVNPPTKKEEAIFPKISEGDILDLKEVKLNLGETKPPARFTEGSLIQTMKNPLKYVDEAKLKEILKENQGIGTEATRASIIEGLKNRKYISLDGKNIFPTEKGIELIKTIPSERIKSVALTGYFEEKLKRIANGEESDQKFLSGIKKLNETFVADVLQKQKENPQPKENKFNNSKITDCPNCGGEIVTSKYGYFCKEKCGVSINREALKKLFNLKTITEVQAKQLFEKGKTDRAVKLHSKKKNKDFSAHLTYKFTEGEKYPNNVWFEFEPSKGKKK